MSSSDPTSSEQPVYQHARLIDQDGNPVNDVADAARLMITKIGQAAQHAKERYEATVMAHPGRQRLHLTTALEGLRETQETAAWATRMLVEMSGIERRSHPESVARRNYPSQREMVDAAGISLATVHSWIWHPAIVVDGKTGPGTLPRPGQTNHGRVAMRGPLAARDRDDFDDDYPS